MADVEVRVNYRAVPITDEAKEQIAANFPGSGVPTWDHTWDIYMVNNALAKRYGGPEGFQIERRVITVTTGNWEAVDQGAE